MPFARGAERRFPAAQRNFQSRGPTSTARILAIRCLSLHLPGKADPRGAGRSAGMDGAATGHKFRRDGSGFQVVWGVVGFGAWKGLQRNGICMKHVGSKHAMLLFACRQPCLRQAQQLQQMTKARVGCARAKGRELAVGRRSARARVEALEGVQKDVRRTVSVMQYNILASCAQCLKLGECSKQGASVTVEVPGQEHTALVSLWCGHQPRGETLLGPCLVPSACPALANRSGRGSSPASTNEALMARGSPGKDPFGVRRVALLATMA